MYVRNYFPRGRKDCRLWVAKWMSEWKWGDDCTQIFVRIYIHFRKIILNIVKKLIDCFR